MKVKFYTFALLAGMALGASAAEIAPSRLDATLCKPVKIENTLLKEYEGNSKRAAKVPASAKDLAGEYYVMYCNMLRVTNQNSGDYSATTWIEQGFNDGEFVITFPFMLSNYELSAELPVKVHDNILSIEPTTVNIGGDVVPFQAYETYVEEVNGQPQLMIRELDKLEAVFSGTGFMFPNPNTLFAAGDQDNGYYFMAKLANFQKTNASDSEMNYGWTSLGKAKFQDGWFLSGLTGGQQSLPELIYDVELQQNESDANVYRLVNPYGVGSIFDEGEAAGYNESVDMNGFIQFNVSDPDHVVFEAVPANYSNSESKVYDAFAMNTACLLINYFGWTLEEAVSYYGDQLLWTSFKDGVLTVPSRFNEEDGGYANDACFGMNGEPFAGVTWQNREGQGTNMEAKIWFPGNDENGVESIEFDENAPVKYYNFQGVEISNPEKGQLVIKTQGSKAQKMIVR